MKCKQFQMLMDEYLDYQLPDAAARECGAHFRSCPSCAAILDEKRRLFEMLDEAAGTPVVIDLVAEVMREVAVSKMPKESSVFRIPVLIAILSGASVCFLAFFLGLGSVLSGVSPFDVGKAILKMVNLPPEIHRSLSELSSLAHGLWIGAAALFAFLFKFSVMLIKSKPVVFLPMIIAASTAVIWFWIARRSRKRYQARS